MRKIFVAAVLAVLSLASRAEVETVPNGSFENPTTPFADPRIQNWQKTPKPSWYTSEFPWEQLTGVFLNTTNGSADHIDNMDGTQALFLFAAPEAGIFMDYNAFDYRGASNALRGRYDLGKSYTATAGFIGGGGGMVEGASVDFILHYLTDSGERVNIKTNRITYSTNAFTNLTHFNDYTISIPTVTTNDAWAGKYIGISIVSSSPFDKGSGYWDVDNVRLTSTISVANHSFELPTTTFADPRIDLWQKFPKPDWYVSEFPWEQLSGVFANTAVGAPDHIDNVDQAQAAFLFAVPQNGVFQMLDATYEVGRVYELKTAFAGGGANMPEGSAVMLALAYADTNGLVPFASTQVAHSLATFPNLNHLVDFAATSLPVSQTDPWANKNIAIMIMAVPTPDKANGYWDLDNVRIDSTTDFDFPVNVTLNGNIARLSWPSIVGWRYQVMRSQNLTDWNPQGLPFDATETTSTLDLNVGDYSHAFFKVQATAAP